jgi:hypothetical protein
MIRWEARRRDPKRITKAEFLEYEKLGMVLLESAENRDMFQREFRDAKRQNRSRKLLDAVFKMLMATVDRQTAEEAIRQDDRRVQNARDSAAKRRAEGKNTLTLIEAWERAHNRRLDSKSDLAVIAKCAEDTDRSERTIIDTLRRRSRADRT